MTDITNREELRELRARAIYEASIPPYERRDDVGPTYFGLDKVRRDRFRKLAEATLRADELAKLAVVPLKATTATADAYMRGRAVTGMQAGLEAAISVTNLLTGEQYG